jgi:23S rRNA (cytosine1962-C5)-methyltransferase
MSLTIAAMIEKRRRFFERDTAFRLCHHELYANLTIDYYAGNLLCTYSQNFVSEKLPAIVNELSLVLEKNGLPFHGAVKKLRPENLAHVGNDKDPEIYHPLLISGEMPAPRFHIKENDCHFLASFHEGHSTGLFLDIKHARRLVQQIAKSQDEVLNLFSYTGGFSIAAAKGGANWVIEVDTSAKWLRWSRDNQELNAVNTVRQRREDAVRFLHKQKSASFDLIICDPPTYSTQKSGSSRFTLEKSYRAMLDDFHRVLRPQGHLLACTNYRGLPKKKFFDIFANKFALVRDVPISEDFVGDDYLKVGLFRKRLAG